jgi:hypothetical protein
MVAAIHDELVARHGDRRDRCTLLEIEDRKSSLALDQKLAVLDGDLKIGPCYFRSDHGTDDRQLDEPVLPVASDLQANRSIDGPAHLLKRLVEGHALGRRVVEMRDDVIGHDASLGGRCVADRKQHLEETILHRDLDAEAAELAAL